MSSTEDIAAHQDSTRTGGFHSEDIVLRDLQYCDEFGHEQDLLPRTYTRPPINPPLLLNCRHFERSAFGKDPHIMFSPSDWLNSSDQAR